MKVDKQKEHEDVAFQKLTTHAKIEVKKQKRKETSGWNIHTMTTCRNFFEKIQKP